MPCQMVVATWLRGYVATWPRGYVAMVEGSQPCFGSDPWPAQFGPSSPARPARPEPTWPRGYVMSCHGLNVPCQMDHAMSTLITGNVDLCWDMSNLKSYNKWHYRIPMVPLLNANVECQCGTSTLNRTLSACRVRLTGVKAQHAQAQLWLIHAQAWARLPSRWRVVGGAGPAPENA